MASAVMSECTSLAHKSAAPRAFVPLCTTLRANLRLSLYQKITLKRSNGKSFERWCPARVLPPTVSRLVGHRLSATVSFGTFSVMFSCKSCQPVCAVQNKTALTLRQPALQKCKGINSLFEFVLHVHRHICPHKACWPLQLVIHHHAASHALPQDGIQAGIGKRHIASKPAPITNPAAYGCTVWHHFPAACVNVERALRLLCS